MMWLFFVLAGAAVFVIAAVTIGRESFRLGHQLPTSIFDLDAAVATVAGKLPDEAQARLTHDEVRVLISGQLDFLQERGVVGMYGQDPAVTREIPASDTAGDGDGAREPGDQAIEDSIGAGTSSAAAANGDLAVPEGTPAAESSAEGSSAEGSSAEGTSGEVVVVEEEALAYVIGKADEADLDVLDRDVHAVMVALHGYMVDIGAIGPTG